MGSGRCCPFPPDQEGLSWRASTVENFSLSLTYEQESLPIPASQRGPNLNRYFPPPSSHAARHIGGGSEVPVWLLSSSGPVGGEACKAAQAAGVGTSRPGAGISGSNDSSR